MNLPHKDLVVSLLTNDMIHNRLIYGLDNLGLEAHAYNLTLIDTVFALIGLEGTERHYDFYYKLTGKLDKIPLHNLKKEVEKLAQEIYIELMALDR
jgi:hypothetical protein